MIIAINDLLNVCYLAKELAYFNRDISGMYALEKLAEDAIKQYAKYERQKIKGERL